MHAIVHRRYGTPDVLTFETIERPVPGDDDVLIRVHAAGVSVGDHHVVTGKPEASARASDLGPPFEYDAGSLHAAIESLSRDTHLGRSLRDDPTCSHERVFEHRSIRIGRIGT